MAENETNIQEKEQSSEEQEVLADSGETVDETSDKTVEETVDEINDEAVEETSDETVDEINDKPEELSEEEFLAQRKSKRREYSRFEKYREDVLQGQQKFSIKEYMQQNLFAFLGILIGILFLFLFITIAVEVTTKQNNIALEGYVAIHYKLPENFKGEPPEHVQKILDDHNENKARREREKIEASIDIHEGEKNMGTLFPESLTNDDLLLILDYQDIGPVTRAGVQRSELVNLSGLDLRKIDFTYLKNFVQSNLKYVNCSGVNSPGAEFRAASMQYSKFVGADLRKSSFIRSKLMHANFQSSILDNSDFREAKADNASFAKASIKNSDFESSNFRNVDFEKAFLDNSNMRYAVFEGANFRSASLPKANFRKANLSGVSFVNADLRNCDFTLALLEGANFEGANIEGANFEDADVSKADFYGATGATRKQLEKTKLLASVKRLPEGLMPKKMSWQERF